MLLMHYSDFLFLLLVFVCLGVLKDEVTLHDAGLKDGTKLMGVGSSVADVLSVASKPTGSKGGAASSMASASTPSM